MKILFVRPPRLTWAHLHLNEDSNNILSLGYPCLAAKVRQDLPEIETTILDCSIEKMGWKSLERYLRENRFDVVGLGSETVYMNADRQVLYWVKEFHPETTTVVGGWHFPLNPQDVFADDLSRFIVRGEGEVTFVEWLKQLMSPNPDFASVEGLIWKDENGLVRDNGPRALVEDLDSLPLPAYDMVPVEKYAKNALFWKNGITIEHGRGCIYGCKFCTFWHIGAEWKTESNGSVQPIPHYRTKSVERTIEEVELLTKKYKKELLFFVDGTFEHDLEWTDRFFDEVLRRDLKFVFWTFSRIDLLLKLEEMGTLEKGVRAGWRQMLMGVEHVDQETLGWYRKPSKTPDRAKRFVDLMLKKYPDVILQATYVGGAPDDTKESLGKLYRYAKDLGVHITSFHFFTPIPGSDTYKEIQKEGLIKVHDFSKYSWFTPIAATRYMTLEELDNFWSPKMVTVNMSHSLRKLWKMFTGDPSTRKLMRVGFVMYLNFIKKLLSITRRPAGTRFRDFVRPVWYDS